MEKDESLRLAAQEFIASNLTTDALVMGLMVRALITTHPHPESVKAAFQVLLSASESQLPDNGFSAGVPVAMTRQMQKQIAREAEKWLGFFPPTPK